MPRLRKNMPQVNTQNLDKAIQLVSKQAKVTKGKIRAGRLKKSQKELDADKIRGIASTYKAPDDLKPLVLANDDFIVDGHHRWAGSMFKWGKQVCIPYFRIWLPIGDAITLYNQVAAAIDDG